MVVRRSGAQKKNYFFLPPFLVFLAAGFLALVAFFLAGIECSPWVRVSVGEYRRVFFNSQFLFLFSCYGA